MAGRLGKTSSVGRSRQLPRRGNQERGLSKGGFLKKMPECCSATPHHLALQGASPQGEAAKRLTIFAEENFVSKILCRQGEGTKWLTIFQARGRLAKTSSVGRSRQLPRRGSQECGLSIKRLFEKMPECCSAAPHHLALQGAGCRSCLKRQFGKKSPPRGSLGKRKKFESTSIVCLRRHFPRYRRFFRAFLSQEKKRKRGKQKRIPAQRNRRSLPKGKARTRVGDEVFQEKESSPG